MVETETKAHDEQARLPVPLAGSAPRPSLARSEIRAAFVSQLLAARASLDIQRTRRRAPADAALDAYRAGARIAVRRLPMGYRRTLLA